MTTLNVGPNQTYKTIAAAVAASHDGDVLAVRAGTYVNDFATINTKITIQGVGGMVNMVATTAPPNGKGILVTNTDVTIRNLSFSGAKVPDDNGAGIRYQAGNLVIEDSYFHHNQNGLLGNPSANGTITIRDSEFAHNGAGDGRTHNLYVGEIAKLTIDDSYFHDAVVGHQIKSRAHQTVITDSRIVDGAKGTGSYGVDLPNGGKAVLTGNVIVQGPHSQNPSMVHFGGEGTPHAGSSLQMSDNSFINELGSSSARLLYNQTGATASVTGNDVFGLSPAQMASGPAKVSGNATLAKEPALDTSSPWEGGQPAPAPSPVPTPAPVPVPTPTPAPVPAPAPTQPGQAGQGTGGNDSVTLQQAMSKGHIDLLGGFDRLLLSSSGANTLTVSHVETILGGSAADAVTLGAPASGITVDLGGGVDRLVLSGAGANRLVVDHVESIAGGKAADAVTLAHAASGISLDLGAGQDQLVLASDGPNALTVANVETVLGGGAADKVTLRDAEKGIAVELGNGQDELLLSSAGANSLTVSGAETLRGGSAADAITLGRSAAGMTVDLGGGKDALTLFNGPNSVTVLNTETIRGGIAGDQVTLGQAVQDVEVDLGAGVDRLFLSSAGANKLVVANAEFVQGGAGGDQLVFSAATLSATVDLGGGVDRLMLAKGGNAVTVANVETVLGGASGDRITVSGGSAASLDGGAGNDTLLGGGGADTLIGGSGSEYLTGGGGADRFVFTAGSSTAASPDRIMDFGAGDDRLVFQDMLRGDFTFLGAGAFTGGHESEARFVDGPDLLQVDANGDGATDAVINLHGVSLADLSAKDFAWS
ncbi:Ca2+-binding protein, RTX toxin-related [Roseomonas rosea]|uniref:Ca2+-binding protein, RTX toxin-related n=1 Tax=Muricoccus roseus TaxID=198092 RepID=A0A1M6S3H2_9PROT|nr:right-handed parallel beta-helix repeat-containing protein [Roseomonas rosea]SHK39362.1 Ca2+-binding protein, RTX toxin-related [Roseomonas rosea]